ncbi:hypothetical protein E2C01_037412 [Portunus trituberculatus]|uniref:Uncharacterized protein n=1 Tax=Portunus trituberculatus TaxID=210409 RepID=A0A5B7F828_PORTR|nr:hypothetical protein [Portunus trituberculatus]
MPQERSRAAARKLYSRMTSRRSKKSQASTRAINIPDNAAGLEAKTHIRNTTRLTDIIVTLTAMGGRRHEGPPGLLRRPLKYALLTPPRSGGQIPLIDTSSGSSVRYPGRVPMAAAHKGCTSVPAATFQPFLPAGSSRALLRILMRQEILCPSAGKACPHCLHPTLPTAAATLHCLLQEAQRPATTTTTTTTRKFCDPREEIFHGEESLVVTSPRPDGKFRVSHARFFP